MKNLLLFVLIFSIMLTFPSCSEKKPIACSDILEVIMDNEAGLPAGKVYSLLAGEKDARYLSERLLNSLFGGGSSPPMRQGWLDAALFLPSSSHPCEFAVILCDTPDTAVDTARILCTRLDVIRNAKKGGEYSALLDNASVSIVKNYVLLIISSDSENALKKAKTKISS